MKNVEMALEGDILTIKVDVSKEFGPSSSGKTIIIATTEGNVSIPGDEDKKIGLTRGTWTVPSGTSTTVPSSWGNDSRVFVRFRMSGMAASYWLMTTFAMISGRVTPWAHSIHTSQPVLNLSAL